MLSTGTAWWVIAGALLAVLPHSTSAREPGERICAQWYTEKREAIFEFYESGGRYHARLIPVRYPHARDSLNPVDSLRNRPLAGIRIVTDLTFDPVSDRWEGGRIYNPEDGRTYSCTCSLKGDGQVLEMRGFIGISLLGGTQRFSRVSQPVASP